MREIKFRAWDRIYNNMYYPKETRLIFESNGIWISTKQGAFHPTELMQYTGLKDKNGKEIYEGDILADTGCPDEHCILGTVMYNNTPDYIYAGQYFLVDKEGYASDWDGVTGESWHTLEVNGNIYENPELLEAIK